MLELDQVSKRLGSFQLRNITIQIPTGYLCGLAGENGAGKTSLLHMLLGLYRPDSGTVRIDGKIYEENEKEIRQQTGIVLAEDLLHPAFSLLQNGKTEAVSPGSTRKIRTSFQRTEAEMSVCICTGMSSGLSFSG